MNKTSFQAHYPKGIPFEINPDRYPSLVAMYEESFQKYADKVALQNMGVPMTFAQLDKLSSQFAAYLQQHTDLQKGDRFAILCPNLLQYPVALVGVLKAGLILVGTNPLYTPREMEYQLKDCGARGMMVLSPFVPVLDKVIANTAIKHLIVSEPTDHLLPPDKQPPQTNDQYPTLPGYQTYRQVLAAGAQATYTPVTLAPDDVAFLQYTGGTTGLSKGAMITHRNIVANMEQFLAWMQPLGLQPGNEVVTNAMPLYHAYSLVAIFSVSILEGHKQLLITNPRDMAGFVQELKKTPVSMLSAVNTIFNGLMMVPEFKDLDFSTMKFCGSGGMPVQRAMVDKWKAITGVGVIEAYGMSECTCLAISNPMDGTAQIGTAGIPVPSTDIKLVDENGQEVAQGQPGEICIRGPQVMKGYWEKPEETALVLKDGWLHSGDIGVANAQGFISIVDRKKDMIIVSGFNVFPNEVEQIVNQHPDVVESACIGVADEHSGEAVKIFVVRKNEALSPETLIAHCKQSLTGYKVPKHVAFVSEIPKSNVGKLLRRELKEKEKAQMTSS